MTKVCPRCKMTYMFAEKHFHKNRLNKDGLSSVCKKCKSEEHLYYKSLNEKPKEKICAFVECDNKFQPTREFNIYCCVSCRDKANKYKNGKQEYYDKKNFNRRFKVKKEIEKATNKDKGWTSADIELLFKLIFDKKSFKEIAKELGRTSNACWKKYYNETKANGIPRINFNKKEKDYNK